MWRTLSLIVLWLVATSLQAERFARPVAVFVAPTSDELASVREQNTPLQFQVWQDEGSYNFEQAEEFLKGLGIEVVHSDDLVYTFTDVNHYEHRVELQERNYPWSIVLFNGVTNPRLYRFPQDAEAKAYFELGKQLQGQ